MEKMEEREPHKHALFKNNIMVSNIICWFKKISQTNFFFKKLEPCGVCCPLRSVGSQGSVSKGVPCCDLQSRSLGKLTLLC